MYILNSNQTAKLEETTFANLNMKENDVEEMIRLNVDMLCDDEESMLIVGQQVKNEQRGRSKDITRRSLPKIDALMEWKLVEAGDVLVAKGTAQEAILEADGQVKTSSGERLSLQRWLKGVFGWPSVQTYTFCVDKKTGKSLSELREAYMQTH